MHDASSRFQEIARWLVRRYPAPWRDRYEDEMLALLDDSPPRLPDVVDLARGLVVERVRASFEPGDRPGLTHLAITLAGIIAGGVLTMTPALVGLLARELFGALPRPLMLVSIVILGVCALMAGFQGMRVSWKAAVAGTPDPAACLPPWHTPRERVLLSALVVAALLTSWGSGMADFLRLFLIWHIVLVTSPLPFRALSAVSRRLQWPIATQMTVAVYQLRVTRHELKWAQMELARCEQLTAAGSVAPLAEARAVIDDIRQRQEAAMTALHGMGYRARLSRS